MRPGEILYGGVGIEGSIWIVTWYKFFSSSLAKGFVFGTFQNCWFFFFWERLKYAFQFWFSSIL